MAFKLKDICEYVQYGSNTQSDRSLEPLDRTSFMRELSLDFEYYIENSNTTLKLLRLERQLNLSENDNLGNNLFDIVSYKKSCRLDPEYYIFKGDILNLLRDVGISINEKMMFINTNSEVIPASHNIFMNETLPNLLLSISQI